MHALPFVWLERMRIGRCDVVHWDAEIVSVLMLVFFFSVLFFSLVFAEQIAAYLNAKIDGIRLKNQREGSLAQAYQDGYNKGYKDGRRDRLRRRKEN